MARHFIPNGCTKSPDGVGAVQWKDCCDLHDLSYFVGGWRRILNGDKFRTDLALGRCMADRWRRSADEIGIPNHVRLRRLAGAQTVGRIYTTGVTLVGWTPINWSWRQRPVPTVDELWRLKGVDHDALQALGRELRHSSS